MSFEAFWEQLRATLGAGNAISNWTVAKGFLGDDFIVKGVADTFVQVEVPTAENIQTVPKRAFEETYLVWDEYCAGRVARHQIRDVTRHSTYTISIIKHIQG